MLGLRSRSISVPGTTEESTLMQVRLKLSSDTERNATVIA